MATPPQHAPTLLVTPKSPLVVPAEPSVQAQVPVISTPTTIPGYNVATGCFEPAAMGTPTALLRGISAIQDRRSGPSATDRKNGCTLQVILTRVRFLEDYLLQFVPVGNVLKVTYRVLVDPAEPPCIPVRIRTNARRLRAGFLPWPLQGPVDEEDAAFSNEAHDQTVYEAEYDDIHYFGLWGEDHEPEKGGTYNVYLVADCPSGAHVELMTTHHWR